MKFLPTIRRPDFVESTTEAVLRVARRAVTTTLKPGAPGSYEREPDSLQYPPTRRARRLIRTAKFGCG